jgi:type VI secretion system protein ImpF
MAKSDNDDIVRPSVLDRLMKRPEGQSERIYYEGVGVRELKEAVARDLERLLNTRMWLPPSADDLEGLDEARSSLITYGIPELSVYSWANQEDAKQIAALVTKAIRTFEPRLVARTVRCEILPAEDISDFALKLRIEGLLHVDPISEHVTFDSGADFAGGGIRIESFE